MKAELAHPTRFRERSLNALKVGETLGVLGDLDGATEAFHADGVVMGHASTSFNRSRRRGSAGASLGRTCHRARLRRHDEDNKDRLDAEEARPKRKGNACRKLTRPRVER